MKVVSRKCTECFKGDEGGLECPRSLEELRGIPAYVLLGEPGAGKTTAFERESKETGSAFVTARDFVTLEIRPEWQGGPLFIDGLDEMRPLPADPRHPLDRVRSRLDALGRPDFRISCRNVDWLGANDWARLEPVSPDGTVRVFRLDPLDQDGILRMIGAVARTATPEGFINEARRRGLHGLLGNPQSLSLLLRAIASGEWPESRMEAYERACEGLSLEMNDEHLSGNPNRPGTSALLETAGRLCTILIMTGRDGLTWGPPNGGGRFVPLTEAVAGDFEPSRFAVRSRLFKSIATNTAVPVHRYISEFLAGRYLAGLVDEGAPPSRVVALLTGYDGYLVSEFQGLSAWLAAHCKEGRALIMDRDPVGTLLYGDVSGFSREEKTRLIRVVAEHLERHTGIEDLLLKRNSSLRALATPDMAASLMAVLRQPDQDSATLRAKVLALRAVQSARRDSRLGSAALELVENESSHPRIRSDALNAYVRHASDSDQLLLLEKVWYGTITDPEDELLGRLLTHLYPDAVPPAQAITYMRWPRSARPHPSYRHFWQSIVLEETDVERIAELLDSLAANRTELRKGFDSRYGSGSSLIQYLPSRLLARYLRSEASPVDSTRLCNWLEIASDERVSPIRADDWTTIRGWLAERPATVEAVFRVIAERRARVGDLGQCVDRAQRLMLGVRLPAELESWCEERGRQESDQYVASVFLSSSRRLLEIRESGMDSPMNVQGESGPRPSLEELLEESASIERPVIVPTEEVSDPVDPERLEWRSQARAKEHLLRQNRCAPAFLEGLAEAYFGNSYLAEGADPVERLHNVLGGGSLVESALIGLRESVKRDDVPTSNEILRLHSQDEWHRLALPVLAGAEEIDRGAESLASALNREELRSVLAFHFITAREHPAPYESAPRESGKARFPRWYRRLVESEPGLVADMMIEAVRSEIQKGLVLYDRLRDLLREASHAEIARRVSVPLLNLIPVRSNDTQLDGLEIVLKSAMAHCNTRTLQDVIEKKLSRRSMTDGQRVYWLSMGLFVDQSRYRGELEKHVALEDRRIEHLVAFISGSPYWDDWHLPFESLDTASVESLVLRCGKVHRPLTPRTQAVQASALIESLVKQLGNDPSPDATDSLERLLLVPHLEPWRSVLQHWLRQQREVRRNVSYVYPSLKQVGRTLGCSDPANAADLLAATVDGLRELARDFRDGDTSGWRQCWNWDETPNPKREELCRDLLVDRLRPSLGRMGVKLHSEGRYADDTRADISVSYKTYNVPVEIKRSTNRELWSALRSQLINKYVRDPGTNGHGIYLVLWFGTKGVPMPPSGLRPHTALDLEQRLRQSLSPDEKLKVSIVVMDVARPDSR